MQQTFTQNIKFPPLNPIETSICSSTFKYTKNIQKEKSFVLKKYQTESVLFQVSQILSESGNISKVFNITLNVEKDRIIYQISIPQAVAKIFTYWKILLPCLSNKWLECTCNNFSTEVGDAFILENFIYSLCGARRPPFGAILVLFVRSVLK